MSYEDQMISMRGGKKYLPVAPRVQMYREEHPGGRIEARIVELDRERKFCLCAASVYAASGDLLASAHGSEEASDFPDYIEKAETKAVGRALSLAGFGTLSAADIDESAVVDTPHPVERPVAKPEPKPATKPEQKESPITACTNCGVLCAPPVVNFSQSKFGRVLCINCQKGRSVLS